MHICMRACVKVPACVTGRHPLKHTHSSIHTLSLQACARPSSPHVVHLRVFGGCDPAHTAGCYHERHVPACQRLRGSRGAAIEGTHHRGLAVPALQGCHAVHSGVFKCVCTICIFK